MKSLIAFFIALHESIVQAEACKVLRKAIAQDIK